MRPISQELQEKLQQSWQTPANECNPHVKVIAGKQAGELFVVETIHNIVQGSDIDVTLKRSNTNTKPDEAYIIYISDGIAKIATKPIPYDPKTIWEEVLELGAASSVAIEFDGYWERDINTLKFNFITLGEPWLFWVDGGSLYAQKWTNNESKIELTTEIVKVAALRGWIPATAEYFHDQGLIVGYIKNDGLIYYRSYCLQSNGTTIWEDERLVPNLPSSAASLSIFRTNDFRVGFLAEAEGQMYWTLSKRNYAGMSFPPDAMSIKNACFHITTQFIRYLDHETTDSVLTITNASFTCNCGLESDVFQITAAGFLDAYTIYIEFGTEVFAIEDWQGHFSVANRIVTNVIIQQQTKRLILTLSESINIFATGVVAYDGNGGLKNKFRLGNTPLVPAFSQTVAANNLNDQHRLEIVNTAFAVTSQPVGYKTAYSIDTDHVLTIENAIFTVISSQVGSTPI